MDIERRILPTADLPLGGATPIPRDLRERVQRAVTSARRDGPGGERLLRRSVAVYAGEACRRRLPETHFVDGVHGEVMAQLTSRMSMKRLARLVDAAAQGAMDGYDLQHRLDRGDQLRRYEEIVRPRGRGDTALGETPVELR